MLSRHCSIVLPPFPLLPPPSPLLLLPFRGLTRHPNNKGGRGLEFEYADASLVHAAWHCAPFARSCEGQDTEMVLNEFIPFIGDWCDLSTVPVKEGEKPVQHAHRSTSPTCCFQEGGGWWGWTCAWGTRAVLPARSHSFAQDSSLALAHLIRLRVSISVACVSRGQAFALCRWTR